MSHAAPEPPRRWWRRRRAAAPAPKPEVIDLRDDVARDPESVVARLARLRDAGLITNAEFERERAELLGDPARLDLHHIDPRALDPEVRAALERDPDTP